MTKKIDKKKVTKTLQFFAAYLVAAWTLLQFVDWVLTRYSISPYWVDLLLWVFIGIIPSLIIYLYNQERINNRVLKLREKIIFPLNIILIILVTYFGFGASDLGATTKNLEYIDDSGISQHLTVTKQGFRSTIPIFGFKQKTQDSTTLWMEGGIAYLLYEDLLQNKNLNPNVYATADISTINKIAEASLFSNYYVDGTYEIHNDTYSITVNIRNAKSGEIIKENNIEGSDFYSLLDEVSVYIAQNSGALLENKVFYIDLPIQEYTSSSLKALEYYISGDYNRAIEADNTFALAYLQQTSWLVHYNLSKLEAQDIVNKAYIFKDKLPKHHQINLLIQRNLAYEHYEDAEKLVQLQLELDPTNKSYNRTLYSIYGQTKQVNKYYETAKRIYEQNPDPENGINYGLAEAVVGLEDETLKRMDQLALINPAVKVYKILHLLLKGDIDAAEKNLEETILLYPEETKITRQVFEDAVAYQKAHKVTNKELERFAGTFRDEEDEQVSVFWIEKDRIIKYVNNQRMWPFTPSGPNNLVGGIIFTRTWDNKFLTDEENNTYGYIHNQYDPDGLSAKSIYWKIDESITVAEKALKEKNYNKADSLYTIAIAKNPKHYYLKDALVHIKYVKSMDSLDLVKQYKSITGTYGHRKFSYDNGKLYYRRDEGLRREFLAISKHRYITLSRYNFNMAFETTKSGKLTSFVYQYNFDDDKWIINDSELNYLRKDD